MTSHLGKKGNILAEFGRLPFMGSVVSVLSGGSHYFQLVAYTYSVLRLP